MELALGAMASLAPKLGDLLMQEYVVQKGLKDDIESLSTELVAINAALIDASKVPPDQLPEMDKFWARQVRELSYDMEDAVDDFILRVAGRESSASSDANVFKKMVSKATAMVKKVKHRHEISDKVRDIKKLSNELAELRAKYTVRDVGANRAANTGIDPRVLNLYKEESDLVGIEESRDKVIRMLTRTKGHGHASDQSLKIVSIVGVGGLGKTTLAKTVYDKYKKTSGCSAFISVGRTPDINRVFEKMLVELDQTYKGSVDMGRWDVERFSNELHGFLEHKRYFIIVDDIWDKESWEAIKYALKDNNCGSRIIMTTRNFEVVSKEEEVYRLKPLSDQNSKKLFYKRIQSQEGERLDDQSDEVSSKIIDKCGGVPLAIIAIASLLVDRPCEHWSEVYESIGFGNADNTKQILDNTKKILSYSYYDLPSYLKPCLLYLSIYPEDWIIETKDMIWMWIGEGLVHLEEDKGSLFEMGERYFNELVNRSLIQPTKDDQIIPRCRIHDIVFDLICELSRGENFITILGSNEQHASSGTLKRNKKTGMPHSACKVRRLAVPSQHLQTMDKPEVLRSLCIIDSKIESMAPLDSFRLCRVLCIRNSYIPSGLLNHLGRLLHLKYLEISSTPVDELPKEVGHMKSLQTLELVNTGLHELPSAVCSLTQLMCLMVHGFKRLPADRMGNLASLEELYLNQVEGRSGTGDFVVELGKMTRLRRVGIQFYEELDESLQKALVQSLCNLRQLQELILSCVKAQLGATTWEGWEPPRMLRRLSLDCVKFWQPPGWVNSSHLPRLCFLYLYVYVVEVQHLDNLARLPELSHLELRGCSWPPGYTVGTDGFKNLRFCYVGTALKFHVGAMPRLEELQFRVFPGHQSFQAVGGVPLEQFPTKDVIGDLDFGVDNLLSLEQVSVVVDCLDATAAEVQEVEAAVSRAVEDHPNRPTIKMVRKYEEVMVSDERREALIQQHIEELFSVVKCKDKPDGAFITYLRRYRRVQNAVISIDCAGARMCEVEKVEKGLRNAAEAHRNHPTIELIRINTDKMIPPDHSDTEYI
ncbi:hypothetical protein U9M48_005292 [Paspalum notatum var. saurae]|uniref:Uncharacterized protein n=1 Tax=Paspalum notatum var. saurae TaxID=547442 RepID=A0AAQ3PQI5_PASNO